MAYRIRQHLSPETRMVRRWRKAQNKKLKSAGHKVPRACNAYRVQISGWPMPLWAKEKSLSTLSSSPTHVWFVSRTFAKSLVRYIIRSGGEAVVDIMEYRMCQRCKSYLLGREAADMREWQRNHPSEPQKPCGIECKEPYGECS